MDLIKDFLLRIWGKYKIECILLISAVMTIFLSVIIYLKESDAAKIDYLIAQEENNEVRSSLVQNRQQKFLIDLSGAVQKPGVYEVTPGARLKDVLFLANGLANNADRDFFGRNYNLARILKDQEKIYIPNKYEIWNGIFKEPARLLDFTQPQVLDYPTSSNFASSITISKISINKASINELDALPGIGVATAQKIIQNRPYSLLEDLLTKKVVNKNLFERIKDNITVE